MSQEHDKAVREEMAVQRIKRGAGIGCLGILVVGVAVGALTAVLGSGNSEAEDRLDRAYTACASQEGIIQADDGAVNTFDIASAGCVADRLGAPQSAWNEIRDAGPRGDVGHKSSWGDHAAIVMSDERFQVVYVVD